MTSKKVTVPEDLTGLSPEELRELAAQAREKALELANKDDEDITEDDLATITSLTDDVERVEAQITQVAAAAEARVQAVRDARERLTATPPAAGGDDEDESEGEQPEDEDESQEEEAPVVEAPEVEDEAEIEIADEAPVAVAAAATRVTPRQKLAGKAPRPKAPTAMEARPTATLSLAAGVPGMTAGQKLDKIRDLVEPFQERAKAFSNAGPTGPRQQLAVASINVPYAADVTVNAGAGPEEQRAAVDAAADVSRLKGNSLVAAGGWCAPSETVYDLCPGSSLEGLFSLPEVKVNRGGLRYTQGPDYSDLYDPATFGWDFTEVEVIAGVVKECIEVTCPPFVDVRLDAVGYCVTSPLLTEVGYPELTADFLKETAIAHQHMLSAKTLQGVITAAGAQVVTGTLGSIAGGALAAVELVAHRERSKNRWPITEAVEAVAPTWLLPVMRVDYSMRNGVDLQNVTDQMILGYFAARNINLQLVYGWQQLSPTATEYPAFVNILVYRQGSFVRGTADVINLSAVYDSTLLAENRFTAAFFEEGTLLLQRCYGAVNVQVPVCAAGRTGIADNVDCFSATANPTP